jgi:hypothetical protein
LAGYSQFKEALIATRALFQIHQLESELPPACPQPLTAINRPSKENIKMAHRRKDALIARKWGTIENAAGGCILSFGQKKEKEERGGEFEKFFQTEKRECAAEGLQICCYWEKKRMLLFILKK